MVSSFLRRHANGRPILEVHGKCRMTRNTITFLWSTIWRNVEIMFVLEVRWGMSPKSSGIPLISGTHLLFWSTISTGRNSAETWRKTRIEIIVITAPDGYFRHMFEQTRMKKEAFSFPRDFAAFMVSFFSQDYVLLSVVWWLVCERIHFFPDRCLGWAPSIFRPLMLVLK